LVLSSALEHHYLKHFQSSFAENFYGIGRTFDPEVGSKARLLKSLLTIVILPYIKHKCDRLFEKYRSETCSSPWVKRFVTIYPFIHLTWEGTVIAFWFLYAVGRSNFHSPFDFILGCKLVPAEIRPGTTVEPSQNLLEKLRFSAIKNLASLLTTSLQYGAFLLQFLDWW